MQDIKLFYHNEGIPISYRYHTDIIPKAYNDSMPCCFRKLGVPLFLKF